MKSNQFGLQGVLFFALILGMQCLSLQAQDEARVAYNNGDVAASKGDFDGAIAYYSQAIEIDPRYAAAYYGRGDAKRHKGDFDGAIADYSQVIEIKPRYAPAYGI